MWESVRGDRYPCRPLDAAAASPLAAFAGLTAGLTVGLTVGLLVLRMNRHDQPGGTRAQDVAAAPPHVGAGAAGSNGRRGDEAAPRVLSGGAAVQDPIVPAALNGAPPRGPSVTGPAPALLAAAGALAQSAAERGERLSQRTLARRLRGEGHRFANQQLHRIATAARAEPSQQKPTHGR